METIFNYTDFNGGFYVAQNESMGLLQKNDTLIETNIDFIIDMITLACAPPTVFFNALVLYIAHRHIDLTTRLNQRFVISMTLADLVYGIVYMSTRLYTQYLPRWICGPYYVSLWMCQISSVMFLLLLNVDKFISIRYPLKYHWLVTETTVRLQAYFSWTVVFLYSVSSFYIGPVQYIHDEKIECLIDVLPTYYVSMIMMFYTLPLFFSLFISIYIFWKGQRRSKRMRKLSDAVKVGYAVHKPKSGTARRIFFVFISTIWTSATFLPYRTIIASLYFCILANRDTHDDLLSTDQGAAFAANDSCFQNGTLLAQCQNNTAIWSAIDRQTQIKALRHCTSPTYDLIITATLCLVPLGSVGNPIITLFTQNIYRSRVKAVWRSLTGGSSREERTSVCRTSTTEMSVRVSLKATVSRRPQMDSEHKV